MIGRRLVDVRLAGVLERQPALVQPGGEACPRRADVVQSNLPDHDGEIVVACVRVGPKAT
jgi:hypothetical protein